MLLNLKKIRILVFIFILSISMYASDYYIDKVSQFKVLSINLKPIMMIGDSITDRGLWNELLNRNDIVNRGISGDTTKGLLSRITINNNGLNKVFIMIGINDLIKGKNINKVLYNYIKILEFYKENNITPIIQSTLFVGDYKNSNINLKVKQLNGLLEKYAQQHSIKYINLNNSLSPNGFLDSRYTNDKLHLNGKGYQVWADSIKKYLN